MGDLFCWKFDTFTKLRNTCKKLIWNTEIKNSCLFRHSLLESKQRPLMLYQSALNIKRVWNIIINNHITERIHQIIIKGKCKFVLKSLVHDNMISWKQIWDYPMTRFMFELRLTSLSLLHISIPTWKV